MSYERSPRLVCSSTIGISPIALFPLLLDVREVRGGRVGALNVD
jgi:hypothetical protein